MQLFAPFALKRKYKFLPIVALVLVVGCLIGFLATTARAETTYVITDGDAVLVHTSSATDPADVLREAGVALEEDDIYTTAAGEEISEINIQRAQQITVHNRGEEVVVSSYGETVGALMDRIGIETDAYAKISEDSDTMTYDGMQIIVDQVVTTNETYTLDIPFDTTYCEDPSLEKGVEKILVEGVPGQLLCRANVTYINGQEQSRNVYEETVEQEPAVRVVAVGTGEAVGKPSNKPLIGDGIIVLPSGEVLTYTHTDEYYATAYTQDRTLCADHTANGEPVRWGVVAIDPKLVPYGTRMFIVSTDGECIYGLSTAEDCGAGIIGKRLDLYMETYEMCVQFGARDCIVYFLGDANWKR